MTYNKLVRDNIPQIFEGEGIHCNYESLEKDDTPAFRKCLDRKLDEEVAGYHSSAYVDDSIEKLADILEVVYTIAGQLGYNEGAVNQARFEKAQKYGTYKNQIFMYNAES